MKIENLKGLVYLKDLNNYQKSLAINEFNKLVDYVNELEQFLNTKEVKNIPKSKRSIMLADDLKKYIDEKHTQEECKGFIDGYNSAIENIIELEYCKGVIYHTCKHFDDITGCDGCEIKEYVAK